MISRSARRWLAAVATLLVALLVARSGHMVLVSHAVCAAHGELVHGEHDEHVVHAKSTKHEHASTLAADGEREDGHDHCHAVAHEGALCAQPFVFELTLLPALAVEVPRARAAELSRRLRLLAAPKTSPPA